MTTKFRKVSAKRLRPVIKKPRPAPKKPAKGGDSKTPVTRVGDGMGHHDTISAKVLYLLVDQPKEPQDSVVLDHGSQVLPMMFTTDAQPLYDTTLVFVLLFEHVADGGKFTLKLQRGDPSSVVELFTDVESKVLLLDDLDLIFDAKTLQSKDVHSNKRVLDYTTVRPRPPYDDADLDQKAAPHSSLGGGD